MQRFDRYVLGQLMVLFGFFALVLVSVYWVNRAVVLFDQLIADGHSAMVFVEFTALTLPSVVAMVMPMAAFIASVYLTNRLSNEAELTVMQAAGFSPWRIARPILIFGVLVMTMTSVLTHALVPTARAEFREREGALATSVTARILREGAFLHPVAGVTVYMRDISADGELSDLLLSDSRDPAREVTYTAERAFLVQGEDGPRILMVSGMAQVYNRGAGQLSTTTFSDLTYDVSDLIAPGGSGRLKLDTVPTLRLLRDTAAVAELAREPMGDVIEEAHRRIQQPILGLVAALVGFAALISGGYSRFGVSRRILGAIGALVVIKLIESAVTEPVRSDPRAWPLMYLPTAVGLGITWTLLWQSARPRRLREAAA